MKGCTAKSIDMETEPIDAMRERIKKIFEITAEDVTAIEANARRNEIIAIAAFKKGQSSPKIKRLEWGCEGFHRTDGSLPDEICASTPFGAKYYIYHLWGTVFQLTYGYRTISFYLDHGVEDVKAIAQADFEKRVMECLDL